MSGAQFVSPSRACGGSTLLEVMVALVLLALLVVPIARGVDSAVDRSTSLRATVQNDGAGSGLSPAAEAWEWGPTLRTATWLPGPSLDLVVPAREGTTRVVGLWCDGWPLGEREIDAKGRVGVPASDLRELVGGELVVRVREAGKTWGPPWRSVVPGSTGVLSSSDAARVAGDTVLGPEPILRTVVHAPFLGNPGLELFPDHGETDAAFPGLTFYVPACTDGWRGAELDDQEQSWWIEEDRALDVYF